MNPVLQQHNNFLIKEHVGMFKAASNYDILDPDTQETLMFCREPHLGSFTKLLRFTEYKRMTPFDIRVTSPSDEPILTVSRGISIFLSKVKVCDEKGNHLGGFQQKFFSFGGAFKVQGPNDEPLCELKGSWRGRNFKFTEGGKLLAEVTQKWAGLSKEMFTTADTYVLSISDEVPADNPVRLLILGAVLCIDMVLKE
jgi:uncharacterized protein YxjI